MLLLGVLDVAGRGGLDINDGFLGDVQADDLRWFLQRFPVICGVWRRRAVSGWLT